jgi:cytochrome P450
MRQRTSVFEAFLLAMTLNPDVHKKAQKVIDEQIGDRLIEVSDRENLPYITCLLKEVLRYVHPLTDTPRTDLSPDRWSCPIPFGKGHVL